MVIVLWVLLFVDLVLFEYLIIFEFFDCYWGWESYEIVGYDFNNFYFGSDYQIWYCDINLGIEVFYLSLNSFLVLVFKFFLVDMLEENGSIEVLLGSQYIVDLDMEGQYKDIFL